LEKKIDDLDNANESNWEKLKEDADTAMDKVKTDMKKWENDIKDALDGK
jgi:peptidoglycan hydrolase CwlO-like protein